VGRGGSVPVGAALVCTRKCTCADTQTRAHQARTVTHTPHIHKHTHKHTRTHTHTHTHHIRTHAHKQKTNTRTVQPLSAAGMANGPTPAIMSTTTSRGWKYCSTRRWCSVSSREFQYTWGWGG